MSLPVLPATAVAVLLFFFSGTAQAACPGVYSGKSCDGDPVNVESDVCTTTGSPSQVTCDLGLDAETSDTAAHFVRSSSTQFRAYGTAGDGEMFCCELTVTACSVAPDITVTIYGTARADEIDLNDVAQSLQMTCSQSSVYGGAEADAITGSMSTTNDDVLYGEDGDDAIHAGDGADVCHGGGG